METKKGDFVELKFTGKFNGVVFDSNIEEDLKKLQPDAKPLETIIAIGESMVVNGLDKALEGKEIGKQYTIAVSAQEGFGERKRELMKTLPLKTFTEKNISPYPGMILSMDDMLVKIITISGARVITDFNNPLAGKPLEYTFTMIRKVENPEEQTKAFFAYFFRFVPEFEIKESVTVKGPKGMDVFINAFKERFKKLIGKELVFQMEESKPKKEEKAQKIASLEAEEQAKEVNEVASTP